MNLQTYSQRLHPQERKALWDFIASWLYIGLLPFTALLAAAHALVGNNPWAITAFTVVLLSSLYAIYGFAIRQLRRLGAFRRFVVLAEKENVNCFSNGGMVALLAISGVSWLVLISHGGALWLGLPLLAAWVVYTIQLALLIRMILDAPDPASPSDAAGQRSNIIYFPRRKS
jgi:hypothetical protein